MKKLGFGCMRLPLLNGDDPTSVDLDQFCRMVDLFLERGFTYFDTAYMYHQNTSEVFVRKALTERHPRESYALASKLPTMSLKEPEDQPRIFEEQLEKCGVDYFDYYLLHNLNSVNYPIAEKLDSFSFIQEKQKEGKIRHIGFSFHDSAKLLDEILTAHPEVEFVQLQINYLDWEDEGIQSRKCYETAVKHGKKVIVMEPVKGGALARIPKEGEDLLRACHPQWSPASWAVRFAAGLDQVMMVLSGMSSLEQLEDNTSYMQESVSLNPEELALLDQVTSIIHGGIAVPCTACGYCVEGCPKNIPIPNYFALYNAECQELTKGVNTHQFYYNNYAKSGGRASDCIGCRACERACPQHLEISRLLKDVAAAFED